MMVRTRLWLAGEVSQQRDLPLIRRLIERVRRCAAHRPLLVCTDGLCSSIRAIRETFRDPVHTGQGRPRLRPWRNICIAQVVKRYAQRRVVAVERRIVDGTPARVETLRRRSHGDGVINTAYIERLNATFRERLASLTRRSRALARRTVTLQHGMSLIGTVYNFCTPHASLSCLRAPRHQLWPPGSRIIAGVYKNCCRIMCPSLSGPHPSTVGVPHMHSNASSSAGAETTVSCGATALRNRRDNPTFDRLGGQLARRPVADGALRVLGGLTGQGHDLAPLLDVEGAGAPGRGASCKRSDTEHA